MDDNGAANGEGNAEGWGGWGALVDPAPWAEFLGNGWNDDGDEAVAADGGVEETGWDVSIANWSPGRTGVILLDLMPLILAFLAPGTLDVNAYAYSSEHDVSVLLWTVYSLLLSSRAWYLCARGCRELWAGLLPFFPLGSRSRNRIRLRAGTEPLRLIYDSWSWAGRQVEQQFGQVGALYAGRRTTWRDWSSVLAEVGVMPLLTVLYLCPSLYHAEIGEFLMPAGVLDAPLLLLCEISTPLLINAPNLVRLVVHHCTGDQLIEIFARLHALEILEIRRPRGPRIQWNDVLGSRTWPRLKSLTIWCSLWDSLRLPTDVLVATMHRLTHLDIAGPLLLDAPNVIDARILHVTPAELVRMLAPLRRLLRLSVPHFRSSSHAASGPQPSIGAVHFHNLQEVSMVSDAQGSALDFARALTAPVMTRFHFLCNMLAPPERACLPGVIADLREALDDQTLNWSQLVQRMHRAQDVLLNADFADLGEVRRLAFWPTIGNPTPAPLSLTSARRACTRMWQQVVAAFQGPEPVHGGEHLRDVVMAIVTAMQVATTEMSVNLSVRRDLSTLVFDLEVRDERDLSRQVVVEMGQPGFEWRTQAFKSNCRNSLASGSARLLEGLTELPVTALRIVNSREDVFDHTTADDDWEPRDVDHLNATLRRFRGVKELTLVLVDATPARTILDFLSNPQVLHALQALHIEPGQPILRVVPIPVPAGAPEATSEADLEAEWGPAPGAGADARLVNDNACHLQSRLNWWVALGTALKKRVAEGGHPLHLRTSRFCCVESSWAGRATHGGVAGLEQEISCRTELRQGCVGCVVGRAVWRAS
ncbi:unnamed protein product [Peniophora sp. CBMAI 1063]|nr:unnamed protein product [Peniophora sp. CBMAI 1063]